LIQGCTRIATDLHDDIGASLSQIAVRSEVARAEAAGGGRRADEPLARIASASRELVDSMSEIVWAVDPRKERFRDLAQHMREYAGDVLIAQNTGFRFYASEAARDQKPGMDARRQVFLIFKECVSNIARHPAARRRPSS
jgi:signal transduction histidine kinase